MIQKRTNDVKMTTNVDDINFEEDEGEGYS
jgi:hypothetical protein